MGIFYIIISKFYYSYELCLVFLFMINKNSKLSFYYTVLLLGLAIDLRIKSDKKYIFNI